MAVNDNTSINGAGTSHRPMRRAEREVTDPTEIHRMLDEMHVVRIASTDADGPFIVPLNFGYEWDTTKGHPTTLPTLWLHSATQGRKVDAWHSNPEVALELDRPIGVTTGNFACAYSLDYESIMAWGTIHEVLDPDKKRHGLTCLMNHMAPGVPVEFKDEVVKRVAVWQVNISRLTTKQREAK